MPPQRYRCAVVEVPDRSAIVVTSSRERPLMMVASRITATFGEDRNNKILQGWGGVIA